ncbi:unnamed protein product [Parajaminaea phylloscopi]
MPPKTRAAHRRRASSVSQVVEGVTSPSAGAATTAVEASEKKRKEEAREEHQRRHGSGLLRDIYTMRWMTVPASALKIASIFVIGYVNWRIFTPNTTNPFEPFLFLSHRVPVAQVLLQEPKAALTGDTVRYQKGYYDLCFLVFYVVVFSFIRQSTTLYVFKPFAKWWGIKNETKQLRLMEQGYAILYWGSFGAFGTYVMSSQDSWWFNLEHLWLKYPHWQMRPELKLYYLLQFSYWLQQALVMLLRLEKPRKDYYELIAHHLVTLWLIGWSYLINLTMIGTTVFVCMDIPDTFLALSKFLNYLALDTVASVVFGGFMFIWTYFRIYLSAVTLWSVWTQFDLIPAHTREWNPEKGWWLVPWMRYQIFAPLFILLLLNIFWYYLMWRILFRVLRGVVKDDREDGESDDEGDGDEGADGGKKQK